MSHTSFVQFGLLSPILYLAQIMDDSLQRIPDWKAKLTSEIRVFIKQQGNYTPNGDICSLIIKTLFDSNDHKKSRLEKVESLRETFEIIIRDGDVSFGDMHFWVANFLVEELSSRVTIQKANAVSAPGPELSSPVQAIVIEDTSHVSQNKSRKPNEVTCATCKTVLLKKNLKRHMNAVHRSIPKQDEESEEEDVILQKKKNSKQLMKSVQSLIPTPDKAGEQNEDEEEDGLHDANPPSLLGKRIRSRDGRIFGRKYRTSYDDADSQDLDWTDDAHEVWEEKHSPTKTSLEKKRGNRLSEPRRRRLNLPSASIPKDVEADLQRYYYKGVSNDGSSVEWKGLRMTLGRFMFWTNPDVAKAQSVNDIDS